MNNKSSFAELIKKEGYILYPFKGISMLPLLDEANDLVRIEESNEYRLYDVILFKKHNNYVLHRIIALQDDIYRVRGDNAVEVDIVKKVDIIGKMVGYFKGDNYISINDEEYQTYLNDNFVNPKIKKKKTINSSDLNKTSYIVNDNIKCAYKALFRYIFEKEFDVNAITKLSKEEFYNFYLLCLFKKSDHILLDIINKYDLKDIDERIVNSLRKTEAVVKSRFLFHDYYKKDLSNLLTKHGIKHLFIKGAELIARYPHPILRSSNDIDIYVNKEDLDKVTNLIKETYAVDNIKDESIHRSFSIYKGKALIEAHYALLEDKEPTLKYLSDPFKISEVDKDNPYLYHLKKEYYYLYHLAHFIKHISMGEFWLSMLMDSYLIKDDINLSLIKEVGLDKFYNELNNTLSIWIDNKDDNTSLEDIILQDALTSYVMVNKNKYPHRYKYILRRLFPPRKDLEESYPKLAKHHYLYIYYLFIRFLKVIFTSRRNKPFKELKTYQAFSKNRVMDIINDYYHS